MGAGCTCLRPPSIFDFSCAFVALEMVEDLGAASLAAGAAVRELGCEEQAFKVSPSKKRKTTPATKEDMFGRSHEQWVQGSDV